MKKAEVTAFLSLIFILLVSFVGGIMESASIQMAKNYRRADMNRAIEAVFAEYQKELLEEYDIFALDGTYETGVYEDGLVKKRLEYFGAGNMEHEIERIEFLTDNGAREFYDQVAYYMKHKYGINLLKDQASRTEVWKMQEEKAKNYENESREKTDDLEKLLGESDKELPQEDNPIAHVSRLRKRSLLELVMPEGSTVSEKKIDLPDCPSGRKLNKGYGDFSDVAESSGTLSALAFGEYLLDHFSMATDKEPEGVLNYELEYICGGKESDRENLEIVVKKLIGIRFAANYLFLLGSSAKRAEAETLALTLCTLAAVPALETAAAQVILLAWAFGESVVDLRALLKGNRVPAVKSEESWQLSLSGLMKLGESKDASDGKDSPDGLSYREYVRMLLFLQKPEKAGMRTLDLIEQNIRIVHGQDFFRADCCIGRMEIKSEVRLRRGITYDFKTYFGYR